MRNCGLLVVSGYLTHNYAIISKIKHKFYDKKKNLNDHFKFTISTSRKGFFLFYRLV